MMDLKTATTYWRESGGEYDQKSERAIISIPSLQKFVVSVIGWTLINNQDGEALLSMKDKLRTAEQERDQYKEIIVEIGQKIKTIQDGADGLVKIWKERCEDFIAENKSLRTQLQESAQLALEWQSMENEKNIELESLRAKIKEAQEPVGIARSDNSFLGNGDCYIDLYKDLDDNTLLYTKPVTQD